MNTRLMSRSTLIGAALIAIVMLIGQTVPAVRAATSLSFAPSPLDFGDNPLYSSSTKTVTITNSGSDPVYITSGYSTPSVFGISFLNCPISPSPLNPGQSCTATVNFFAPATGTFNGELILYTQDAGSPYRLNLTGKGAYLLNGSFEIDSELPTLLPDLWSGSRLTLGSTRDGRDCTTWNEGACSMRFKGDGNGSKIVQDVPVSGGIGDVYLLTFDTSSLNAGGSGAYTVQVKFFNSNGTKKVYTRNLPTGTNSWATQPELVATAVKPYYKIRIIVKYSKTKGFVWFDNFVLLPQ